MNYTIKNPKAFGLFFQTGPYSIWKTLSQVKEATGADALINAQMWNMSTLETSYSLKVNGVVKHDDRSAWPGYGWNNGEARLHWTTDMQMAKYDNFIGCEKLVENGISITASNWTGKRGRTGMGLNDAGEVVLLCVGDGTANACDTVTMAKKMVELGCVNAIMLDGGGSSQMICPDGAVPAARKVQSVFYAVLGGDTGKSSGKPSDTGTSPKAVNTGCPYQEPTAAVVYGTQGEGGKWLQWWLVKHGLLASTGIDGIVGNQTITALKKFQTGKGLAADGICGAVTRKFLKGEVLDRPFHGIDCASIITAQTAENLYAAGKRFAGRYIVPANYGSKHLSASEARAIRSAGLAVLPIWETTGKRTLSGKSAGTEDGKAALQCALDLGIPAGTCIYFAECDFCVTTVQMPLVEAYLNAVRAEIGKRYLVGLYGPYNVVEEMAKRNAADRFWQCVGWSDGQISDKALIYQSNGSSMLCGISVDFDQCTEIEDCALWAAGEEDNTTAPSDNTAAKLAEAQKQLVELEKAAEELAEMIAKLKTLLA